MVTIRDIRTTATSRRSQARLWGTVMASLGLIAATTFIGGAPSARAATTAPYCVDKVIASGSKDTTCIRLIQRIANTGWSSHLSVDGVYGPATVNAIKLIQQSNSYTVDGITGPITWGAGHSGLCIKAYYNGSWHVTADQLTAGCQKLYDKFGN